MIEHKRMEIFYNMTLLKVFTINVRKPFEGNPMEGSFSLLKMIMSRIFGGVSI
jgi:hypothetical protein